MLLLRFVVCLSVSQQNYSERSVSGSRNCELDFFAGDLDLDIRILNHFQLLACYTVWIILHIDTCLSNTLSTRVGVSTVFYMIIIGEAKPRLCNQSIVLWEGFLFCY